ncbi:tripartite tricarboxylate transporter TctB family protein [Shouchella hunanensis]|uniref:Tripartite tricarboxylate transporter TctB family protein n=1 Tax=Shouchella hunanensis TaxID=766894 RepID=A0ABY7W0U3_9BACI|nr:tripartite tricarboxylate transporter TctB family protein [Shouchella hunanensis]WDF02166.1 tripartite tricarboxylate transporter TctB family protein [Shouchella hunanensis]
MTMNQKISIPLFILAIGYLLATWLLPKYEYILIDADIFPLLLGGLLALFSVILFFSKDEEGAKIYIAKDDLKVIVPVVLLMLLYILLLEPVGFVITTVCFIFICSLLLGYKKHVTNGIVAVLFPVAFYFLFTRYLMIALPSGILPI